MGKRAAKARRESEKIMLTLSDEAVDYLDAMRSRWGLTRSAFLEAVLRITWEAPHDLRQELMSNWMAQRPAPSERKRGAATRARRPRRASSRS